jgi:hypothetical protein
LLDYVAELAARAEQWEQLPVSQKVIGRYILSDSTIKEILDDLRAADEVTRRFERRYWLSSADIYSLYRQGQLDDGRHAEDFAIWVGFYQIKLDREAASGHTDCRRPGH